MNHEPTQSAGSKPADDEKRQHGNDSPAAWTIMHGDADFPRRLLDEIAGTKFLEVHGTGDRSILKQQSLGLICSVQCPGSIVIQTFDAIRELRDVGIVVAGGFHSPMEKECLDFLLRGEQPVIVCPAKGLARLRMPASWRAAVDAGRLLLISDPVRLPARNAYRDAEQRADPMKRRLPIIGDTHVRTASRVFS